jgi:hypothetical protein
MVSFNPSQKQIIVSTLFILALWFLLLSVLKIDVFKSNQLNAAGLNSQIIVGMINQGKALTEDTDSAIAAANTLLASNTASTESTITMTTDLLWKTADTHHGMSSIPLSDRVVDYVAMELDAHPKSYPVIGQQIILPLLNDQTIVANVETMTLNPNGDYSWRGHIKIQSDEYPVVMTYGEHSTFATITTPNGSYTMEASDGLGWRYKNPAEPELTSAGASDFKEP